MKQLPSRQKFGFIKCLVNKITRKSQSNNDEFNFYRHKVVLQSGTKDYMDVTVYNSQDRYSGIMVSFDFDYWTYELRFYSTKCRNLTDTVIKAFKAIYGNRISVSYDEKEYEDELTFK